MEQTVQQERRVHVIPATKSTATAGQATGRKQRVAAYCRVSTDSEEQLTSYTAQKAYYTQKIDENPDWEMAGIKVQGTAYCLVLADDKNKFWGRRMGEPCVAICPNCGEVSIYLKDVDKLEK